MFVLAAWACIVFVGLRYQVGGDWRTYLQIYYSTVYASWLEALRLGDPGYMLLNKLGVVLGFDIWFVNLACAAIFGWGVARFAEQQPNPWLAFVVATPYLIIVVAMGYTRQAVAIGLLMAAIASFQKQSIIRFLVYSTLAVTFHKTAVVILPLIALSAVRYRVAIYIAAAVLGAALFLFFLDTFLNELISNYVDGEMESEGTGLRVAMNLVPAIVFLVFQRRFVVDEQERLIWRNFALAAVATIVGLAILPSTTVIDRIALYLIPLQMFVLSRLPYAWSTRRSSDALMILVILYSAAIQFVWLNFAAHSEYWLPYRFFPFE